MTRERMNRLLELYPGTGAETTNANGNIICYFYEDFKDNPETGIDRAMRTLYPLLYRGVIKSVKFISHATIYQTEHNKE